ncbi:MAG TPA: DNRLRE domain-containing protein [Pirellulales bacterium]|nr:DNRLRE domain-containing protein [Pirellulales bacterium]
MLVAAGLIASPPLAAADTIQPIGGAGDDVFTYQFLSTFNFKDGQFGTILSAGKTTSGHDTESLLHYDLSGAGLSSAQVTSATFQLYVDNTAAAGFGASPDASHPIQIDLYPLASSPAWDASTVTWSTMPGAVGATPAASVTISAINQYVTFDVTSLVQQWIGGSLANNGFLLVQHEAVSDGSNDYVGVFDSSGGSHAPLLMIVPEPATMALALVAVPPVTWVLRRRAARTRGAGQGAKR